MISINDVEIKATIFPDGTSQIWQLPTDLLVDLALREYIEVKWKFESEAEIFHLIQLSVLLRTYCPKASLNLSTQYWPYARQDKEVRNDQTFARGVFETLMSGFYDSASGLDVHSDTSFVKSAKPDTRIAALIKQYGYNHIVFPDAGAKNRYRPVVDIAFGRGLGLADNLTKMSTYFRKVRNQKTGKIEVIEPQSDITAVDGKKCLIVDDICDGGGTFCGVAEQLRNAGAKSVGLYCTHLILSKGCIPLFEAGITNIYNTKGLAFSAATNGGHGKTIGGRSND